MSIKIKIIKRCSFSGITCEPGTKAQVQDEIALKLIKQKKAERNDFVTGRDTHVETISATRAVEILDELPTDREEMIKEIKKLTNKPALELIATDSVKTIRDAALNRLKQL